MVLRIERLETELQVRVSLPCKDWEHKDADIGALNELMS